ncbi:DUF5079 family protein [Staphylococcus warneri]|uniref:DUF5079 family protein n=1 Tax=Staphylococcus TaxID=1279 RepID=UPI00064080BD|nr:MULTISPECIES: DUF5079 family protein [Staphylococcus]KTW19589.1 membrane protein [Staphylococcus warneri]KTW23023.1 membrane protein [Staphylococcus warneri]MCG7305987.1 DUF5079 family protein [Staphylococcus warneri]PNN63622.1 DUF5079 domain-containing protein [Staphylococcus sp. FDAARGOS_39]
MEESLKQLRKPAIQYLNIFSLIFIFFSCLQYNFDLTIEYTPIYLVVTTIIAIIINILGLLQFLEKKVTKPIKRAKRYLIINILSSYTVYMTFYNLYFFVAAEHHYYLDNYWYFGIMTLLFCSTAHILSILLMMFTPNWSKENKMVAIIILKGLASLIYIQKIVEYFVVPNIAESHFIFLLSLLFIFACNFIVTQYYLLYVNVYTEVNDDKNN